MSAQTTEQANPAAGKTMRHKLSAVINAPLQVVLQALLTACNRMKFILIIYPISVAFSTNLLTAIINNPDTWSHNEQQATKALISLNYATTLVTYYNTTYGSQYGPPMLVHTEDGLWVAFAEGTSEQVEETFDRNIEAIIAAHGLVV